MPPAIVISPQTKPRNNGVPRPDSLPSSAQRLGEAHRDARRRARPRDRPGRPSRGRGVAKAAANTGASVDTEPSIRPTRPGWITCSTKRFFASSSSPVLVSPGRRFSSASPALRWWRTSSSAISPSSLRTAASVERAGRLPIESARRRAPSRTPAGAPPRPPAGAPATGACGRCCPSRRRAAPAECARRSVPRRGR